MRSMTWQEYPLKMAIALCVLSMAACRPPSASAPPSSSPPELNTAQESQPPVVEPIPVTPYPPSTTEPSIQELTPQPSQEKHAQPLSSLPTLPTTPIEALPSSERPKTTANPSATTASSNPDTTDASHITQVTKDVLAKGRFVSGEHPTQGEIIIVDDEGTPVIEFGQDFQTTNGPDLVIVLHRSSNPMATPRPPGDALQEGDYVEIAFLKANQGKQHYSVPAAVILDNYNSVAVWCRTFNAIFGTASLQ